MKRIKGFTLIELLAVLVVLAILALISIPITIRIINNARENSYKRSIANYGRAVENTIGKYLLTNDIDYDNIKLSDIEGEVEYNGSKVTCRKLKYKDNGDIVLNGCTVNNIDYYKYEDRQVTKEKYKYDIGEIITVNKINFYVINDNDDYVTALKEFPLTVNELNKYGIIDGVNYINKYTYNSVNTSKKITSNYGGIAYYSSDTCGYLQIYGDPVYTQCVNDYNNSDIKLVIDNWADKVFTNQELVNIPYNSKLYQARLISSEEYRAIPQSQTWKNLNFNYWTMTPDETRPWLVYIINYSGGSYDAYNVYNTDYAVRPVINVKKSAIE